MMQHKGIISKKSDKKWHDVTLYSFQIEGETTWYRTGKDEIEQPVGATVCFTERNSKVDALKVHYAESQGAAPQSTAPSVLESEPADVQMDVGQRIQWQNARADACRLICTSLEVDTLVEGGVLPWPKNLAKAKRLDHLRGYINELTKQFIEEEIA